MLINVTLLDGQFKPLGIDIFRRSELTINNGSNGGYLHTEICAIYDTGVYMWKVRETPDQILTLIDEAEGKANTTVTLASKECTHEWRSIENSRFYYCIHCLKKETGL